VVDLESVPGTLFDRSEDILEQNESEMNIRDGIDIVRGKVFIQQLLHYSSRLI
jgi:hypothetical protein